MAYSRRLRAAGPKSWDTFRIIGEVWGNDGHAPSRRAPLRLLAGRAGAESPPGKRFGLIFGNPIPQSGKAASRLAQSRRNCPARNLNSWNEKCVLAWP